MKEELLEEVIQIVNPREKATQDRLRILNARLKEYTAEEILESAIAFSHSQWHKENNQMSVDNLLRPSKFGRWYAQRVIGSSEKIKDAKEEKTQIKSKQDEMLGAFDD